MIVVSNSSPLIALALVDQLALLPTIYQTIYIAPAVRTEVIRRGKSRAGATTLAKAKWILTVAANRRALSQVRPRPAGLHRGEIETIALALQLKADLVLIDEHGARKFSKSRGLNVLGTLGVLKFAHQRGLLADLRAALDDLRSKGFRFSDTLYREILSA